MSIKEVSGPGDQGQRKGLGGRAGPCLHAICACRERNMRGLREACLHWPKGPVDEGARAERASLVHACTPMVDASDKDELWRRWHVEANVRDREGDGVAPPSCSTCLHVYTACATFTYIYIGAHSTFPKSNDACLRLVHICLVKIRKLRLAGPGKNMTAAKKRVLEMIQNNGPPAEWTASPNLEVLGYSPSYGKPT